MNYLSVPAGFCVKAMDPSYNELFGRFLIVFVVSLLFVTLKHLIKWTTHDVLLKTMSTIFCKHCPQCVVIINGFKIFIDHLKDLLAGPRHTHNINITTRSNISLVLHSKAQLVPSQMDRVAGQVIAKYITERCSLLSNLVPGDTVLADRGFDISNSVGYYFSTFKIPAFTMGHSQLSAIVEQLRSALGEVHTASSLTQLN